MTGPDHGGAGRAKGRQKANGPLDVLVADVAEHSTGKDEVRGHGAGVGRALAGVPDHNRELIQAKVPCIQRSDGSQLGIDLDLAASDITPWLGRDRPQKIASLTRAHRYDAHRRSGEVAHDLANPA